jgi:hypothetical protein
MKANRGKWDKTPLINISNRWEWSTSRSSWFTRGKEACCPLLNLWYTNTNSRKLCPHFVKTLYVHYEAGYNMFNTNLLLKMTKWFSHRYYNVKRWLKAVTRTIG